MDKDLSSDTKASNELDQLAMQALADGHDSALNEIMDRWQKPITSFLYQTIGDYDASLDLAQQVFVQLYRNRKRYKPGRKFSSYLFTIASNLAKNHFRWKSRHPESRLNEELDNREASGKDPQRALETNERSAQVRDAVVGLPENLRIPVVLFYFEGMSHAEIAEIIKASAKTVETRLYRARQLLKDVLG